MLLDIFETGKCIYFHISPSKFCGCAHFTLVFHLVEQSCDCELNRKIHINCTLQNSMKKRWSHLLLLSQYLTFRWHFLIAFSRSFSAPLPPSAPKRFCRIAYFIFMSPPPLFEFAGRPRERKREISESVAETERREGEKGKQEKKPPADFPIYRTSGNGHGFFLPLLSLSLFHFRFSPPHSSCQSLANTGFILPCAGTSKENSIKYGKKDTIIISSCETFKESLPISTGPGTKSKRFHPHPSPLPPPPFFP